VTDAPVFGKTFETLEASLEESEAPTEVSYPGATGNYVYLEGRAIEPKELPDSYKPFTTVAIRYTPGKRTIEGKFYILPSPASGLGITRFGAAIAGYLVFD
jgi:hypothetical protein